MTEDIKLTIEPAQGDNADAVKQSIERTEAQDSPQENTTGNAATGEKGGGANNKAKGNEAAAQTKENAPSFTQLIRERITEEDAPLSKNNLTFRKIIGGDILTAEIVRQQIWLIMLISFFFLVYIAQGYSYKTYMLEIDKLSTQLRDAKYRALGVRSDLTEHTRQSKILDMLKIKNDTTLMIADRPPFIIEVKEE